MFGRLKRLYISGRLTAVELANAVIKRWISEAQKQEIIAAK